MARNGDEPTTRIAEGNGMKSEFDIYLSLTFQNLGIGHFCLEKQRFISNRTIDKPIEKIDKLYQDNDQAATDSIAQDRIDLLSKSNKIENSLDGLCAKLDLDILIKNYKEN